MSYILDALNKSEQERKKGEVPGLGSVQGLPGGRFETDWLLWLYSLATILLVAVLAAGLWLVLRQPAAPLVGAAYAPAVRMPLPVSPSAVAMSSRLPPSARADGKATVPVRSTSRLAKPPTLDQQAPGAGGQTLLAAAPQAAVASPAAPASPPLIEPAPALPTPFETMSPEQPADNDPGTMEPEVQVKPELLPIVPIDELPAETRAGMPTLKIGVHLFSDTPASRRASLNGRLLREGQTVDKDLILEEITNQGVVLSFRGRKFTMPVFPR